MKRRTLGCMAVAVAAAISNIPHNVVAGIPWCQKIPVVVDPSEFAIQLLIESRPKSWKTRSRVTRGL